MNFQLPLGGKILATCSRNHAELSSLSSVLDLIYKFLLQCTLLSVDIPRRFSSMSVFYVDHSVIKPAMPLAPIPFS